MGKITAFGEVSVSLIELPSDKFRWLYATGNRLEVQEEISGQ
jgi:hypothetical protein